MSMENGPFENVFPTEHGDIPLLCSIPQGCIFFRAVFWEKMIRTDFKKTWMQANLGNVSTWEKIMTMEKQTGHVSLLEAKFWM